MFVYSKKIKLKIIKKENNTCMLRHAAEAEYKHTFMIEAEYKHTFMIELIEYKHTFMIELIGRRLQLRRSSCFHYDLQAPSEDH